jgi:hypothetical protein
VIGVNVGDKVDIGNRVDGWCVIGLNVGDESGNDVIGAAIGDDVGGLVTCRVGVADTG